MLSSTQPVSFEYLPDHLACQAARSRRASVRSRRSYNQRNSCRQSSSTLLDVIERVAQEMHVAALIGRLRENLAQCCPQAGMIVGHDKFDAMQTTGLQPEQEIAPARPALAACELDRQHLTAAVPVGAVRDPHRP